MKKLVILPLLLLFLNACKNETKEVEVDETKVENPADTLSTTDTIVMQEIEKAIIETNSDATQKPAAAAPIAENTAKAEYISFGNKITPDKALSEAEMLKKYKSMKAGDTINVKFASTIKEVCKKKGCWMSMALPGTTESFVRFKDYGFFVPKNADASYAVVSGKAFLDVVSVAQLQHYAKDGGKSQEEIEKIKEPKVTYAFQADGVLIRE